MRILFHLIGSLRRQQFDDLFQQIAKTQHVQTADRDGIAKAQIIEFIHRVVESGEVHLIDHQQHGLMGLAQQIGYRVVVLRQS